MLDRSKLLRVLAYSKQNLFADRSSVYDQFMYWWRLLVADESVQKTVQKNGSLTWQGAIDATHHIESWRQPYTVLGVDGSQIYPDRHYAISCYVINIGSVLLSYGAPSKASLSSEPHLFDHEFSLNTEWVNMHRQLLELESAYEMASTTKTDLVLFDGALACWYIQNQSAELKDFFLERYMRILYRFFESRIACASYISYPKSKELIHLLKKTASVVDSNACMNDDSGIIDTIIINSFLEPSMRTTVFMQNDATATMYPASIRPCFVYMHADTEIARIELPAWVAEDVSLLNRMCALIYDQAHKGNGYPICLSEAHEQAVVTAVDRDFFYRVLEKMSVEEKQRWHSSQKLKKKMKIAV